MQFTWKTFRELSVDEVYAILKLRFDVFILEQRCFYPELDGEDQTARHLMMQTEGRMAPLAYLRVREKDEALSIGRVVVHPDHRGRKLGEALMRRALDDLAVTDSGRLIMLQAQAHLLAFYGGFGFNSTSDIYDEDGIPHIDMSLAL